MKTQLYTLESLKAGSEDYHDLIASMMEGLHRHNDEEETKDLPLLEKAIGIDASKEAAASFKKTKKLVPTRCVCYLCLSFMCADLQYAGTVQGSPFRPQSTSSRDPCRASECAH